jgi:hypothetical protein
MYTAVLDTPWTRHKRQELEATHVNVIARLPFLSLSLSAAESRAHQ